VDKKRADIDEKLRRLLDARIEIHAQVVLCPEINDGDVLRKTIYDLAEHHPLVKSVAIVPLGLTRYNTDKRLTAVTPEFCRRTIREVKEIQKDLSSRLGTNFAFLGDEIFLRGGVPLPSRKHYGDYPQIEDGIGMVNSFQQDFAALVRRLRRKAANAPVNTVKATVLTGTLFAPVLNRALDRLNAEFGAEFQVIGVENGYFGGDVSVAGLLTGKDFLSVREQVRGDLVIIPASSLKSGEEIMLDGMTLGEVQQQMGLPVKALDLQGLSALMA
jgi:putative radical SAM enzyme (TIGR03279 family)